MTHNPKEYRNWKTYLVKTALEVSNPKWLRKRCIENYAHVTQMLKAAALLNQVYGMKETKCPKTRRTRSSRSKK